MFINHSAAFYPGGDDHQLIVIYTGDVWFLSAVVEESINLLHYHAFSSVKEFINFFNANKL